jgi:hypothetical protein
MIMRTTTPTAWRSRFVRRGCFADKNSSTAESDSNSRTTPANGARS